MQTVVAGTQALLEVELYRLGEIPLAAKREQPRVSLLDRQSVKHIYGLNGLLLHNEKIKTHFCIESTNGLSICALEHVSSTSFPRNARVWNRIDWFR
jgi:hypothetical protein